VRGNRQIKRSLIRRYTGINHGARFSQTQLVTAQHRLYGSQLFERVYLTVMPADSADTLTADVLQRATDSLDVRVDVAELGPRSMGFGIGLQLPPWRGLLSADWEDMNVAGEGHDFHVSGDYSPVAGPEFLRDYLANLDVTYRIPYVTRWAINFSTHPYGKWTSEKQLRQLELGAETGMSHDFSPTLTMSLLNNLEKVARYDTVAPASAITNLLGVSLTWDTRNDLFNPSSGFYVAPTLEVAGGFLGGSNSFYRARLEARFFRRLFWGHILALRAIGGYVAPYGHSDSVPDYEEFYLGGTNSVRGYNEKSIGPVIDPADSSRYGDVMLNTNVELRSPFIPLHISVLKGLGAVVFQDGGLVRSRTEPSVWNRYQLAAGAGIRLNTVIGPIRLDYGKRLTSPSKGDWGKIHFAILNLF
jgi:outer membrane protein assembly factor BamA